MGIEHQAVSVHLNYFSCLEDDLLSLSRWIEFCAHNEAVYSIELARLLMTACAEVDVVARALCKAIAPDAKAESINAYQAVLMGALPLLSDAKVNMARFGMSFIPWANWVAPKLPPLWWMANNKVKHHRAENFHQASLKNVLNAVAGLVLLLLLLHSKDGPYFPVMPKLMVPGTFAMNEGRALRILIPDGCNLPW